MNKIRNFAIIARVEPKELLPQAGSLQLRALEGRVFGAGLPEVMVFYY